MSSAVLQKDVFLYSKEKGHFSDNFFDILPNETKTIHFKTNGSDSVTIQIKSINNLIR
ncbi:glycoside hydrolase family 2 protein [Lacinutrix salivirga]